MGGADALSIRHIVIRGRVQGVGYRAWTADEAVRLDLQGWVRNRRDGSGEALFAGPAERVADMIERCRGGPALARVEAIADLPADDSLMRLRQPGERFSMLPTV